MRRILLVATLLALTVSVGAQAPPTSRIGLYKFKAEKHERLGKIDHLAGGVVVWVGSARITADEALVNVEADEIEFRGTVHMKAAR